MGKPRGDRAIIETRPGFVCAFHRPDKGEEEISLKDEKGTMNSANQGGFYLIPYLMLINYNNR